MGAYCAIVAAAAFSFAALVLPNPPVPPTPTPVPSIFRTPTPQATPGSIQWGHHKITPETLQPEGRTLTVGTLPPEWMSEESHRLPQFDSEEWVYWVDLDTNCRHTQNEIYAAQSLKSPPFVGMGACVVVSGEWYNPYDGQIHTEINELIIDHLVPLYNAHLMGGWNWTRGRKIQFANDVVYAGHLLVVDRPNEYEKSANGPESWKPPNREYWCRYAVDWISIKEEWQLATTVSELHALKEMIATCEKQFTINEVPAEELWNNPIVTNVTPEPGDDGIYECAEIRDRVPPGEFQIVAQYILEYHKFNDLPHRHLDKNRDRIACNE